MLYLVEILLVGLLGIVIYQDFKFRAVSWIVFPILGAIASALGLMHVTGAELLDSAIVNLGFVGLIFGGLTLYFSIKERALVNIINKYIGIADLLLLIVIALLFSPVNFIMYYVTSLVLITMGSVVYLLIKKDMKAEIPLAGAFSIVLIVCLAYAGFTGDISLYDDGFVIELLNPLWLTT